MSLSPQSRRPLIKQAVVSITQIANGQGGLTKKLGKLDAIDLLDVVSRIKQLLNDVGGFGSHAPSYHESRGAAA